MLHVNSGCGEADKEGDLNGDMTGLDTRLSDRFIKLFPLKD